MWRPFSLASALRAAGTFLSPHVVTWSYSSSAPQAQQREELGMTNLFL